MSCQWPRALHREAGGARARARKCPRCDCTLALSLAARDTCSVLLVQVRLSDWNNDTNWFSWHGGGGAEVPGVWYLLVG